MKNMNIAFVAALATVMCVVFGVSANAQSVTFGSERKALATGVSAEQKSLSEIDSLTLDYIEALGSRKHDELMLKTSDGRTYWKGRAVEGFFIGVTGGASYIPNASAFSYIAGAEIGYSLWWGDFLVTGRVGNVTFDGSTYLAPSAFAEARFNLAHWGANKQHRFYLGGRVGYQYTESDNSVEESGDNYDFYRKSKLTGSGLGYGVVMGWEVRQFMSGHRFGIQAAAYTYDTQHQAVGKVNGETVVDKNSLKQGWQVEITLRYSFQFGKTKKNY